MTAPYLPVPIFRAFTSGGLPLAGGLLYTYAAGSSTPQATYGADGVTTNANPVVLDTTGSATVRLQPNLGYKLVLKDSGGATQWTEDNYLPYGADAPVFSGTVTGANFTTTGTTTTGTLTVTGNATVAGTLTVTGGYSAPISQTVKNANYTLQITDANDQIAKTDTNSWTYSIPANASVAFPVGTIVEFVNGGTAGTVTISGLGPPPTVYSYMGTVNGSIVLQPNQSCRVRKIATDTWLGMEPTPFTYVISSFTGTLTGTSGPATGLVSYVILAGVVTLTVAAARIGTSNATSFTVTGLPAAAQPLATRFAPCMLEDNGVITGGWGSVTNGSGTITFGLGYANSTSGFTASGNKGLPAGFTMSYPL